MGLLFTPVAAGIGAAIGLVAAFLGFTALDLLRGKKDRRKLALATVIVAGAAVVALLWSRESGFLARAREPVSTAEELARISQTGFFLRGGEIREALAQHPAAPTEVLASYARSGDDHLASLVAGNPSAPESLLREIAARPPSYVRHGGLARNPKLPGDLMERLVNVEAKDFSSATEYGLYQVYVLGALARREDLPQALFDRLASWENPEYFLVVALLYAPRISCSQLRRFLAQENEVLTNTAKGVFAKKKCLE